MNRRFNIAMIAACPFPFPRGTPIRIFRMADALAKRGHHVHVVTYHLGEHVEQPPFVIDRIPNVPTYRKVSPGPSYQKLMVLDALLTIKLARLLRRKHFDVIHAHHFEGLLTARLAAKRKRIPIIFDAHTLLESELPFYRLGLLARTKKRLGRMLDRRLPVKADHVIAVTDDIRDKLVEEHQLPASKVSVITNGVELEHFNVNNPDGDFSLRHKHPTVVFAGNLARYQGVDHLLEAFRLVVDQCPEARLRIISGDALTAYQSQVDRLKLNDHIETAPANFERLPRELAAADVAVNPRCECDGIPQKLLNYMSMGLPIVSFAGSAKNLVHGELAWVAPDHDIPAFAQGVLALLKDRKMALRLGEQARRYVCEQFSWDYVAERIESVYEQLVSCANGADA